MLIILGFEGLESQAVIIVSALISLSLSLGLVSEHLVEYAIPYLVFCIVGFISIATILISGTDSIATIVLAVGHGIAGMIIFLLPIILSIQGSLPAGSTLVGVGGALIGVGGLLLALLRMGKPIISRKIFLTILPVLLF